MCFFLYQTLWTYELEWNGWCFLNVTINVSINVSFIPFARWARRKHNGKKISQLKWPKYQKPKDGMNETILIPNSYDLYIFCIFKISRLKIFKDVLVICNNKCLRVHPEAGDPMVLPRVIPLTGVHLWWVALDSHLAYYHQMRNLR